MAGLQKMEKTESSENDIDKMITECLNTHDIEFVEVARVEPTTDTENQSKLEFRSSLTNSE